MKQLFIYAVRNTIADGVTVNDQINISNDTDFILKEIRTTGNIGVTVSLKYSNGNNFSNIPFSLSTLNTQAPLKLFDEIRLTRNQEINFLITNESGSSQDVEIQLIGVKVR